MQLFELFATLGLETAEFEAELKRALDSGLAFADKLTGALTGAGAFLNHLPRAGEVAEKVGSWWAGAKGPVEAACAWELRLFDMPAASDAIARIESWWRGVASSLSLTLPAPRVSTASTGSNASIGSSASTSVGSNTSTGSASGRAVTAKAFATGLDYVPYNGFPAFLHEGEAVLTKLEASDWRQSGSHPQSIDLAALGQTVAAAVREGMRGVGLYVDRERLGEALTEPISRQIADRAWAGRYAT